LMDAAIATSIEAASVLGASDSGGEESDRPAQRPVVSREDVAKQVAINAILVRAWSGPEVGVYRTIWLLSNTLVPIFLLGTLVLFVLDQVRMLEILERGTAPLIQSALGLPREATSAFLVGFFRRDYGAAGLYAIFQPQMAAGPIPLVTEIQIVVSMITITLFVPCVANVFMMIKERGWRTAVAMVAFIFPFAFLVGALVNYAMRAAYGLL